MTIVEAEIVRQWTAKVVARSKIIDPNDEHDWFSLWAGFVIGLGRPDLALYDAYMRLGFPVERLEESNEDQG